MNTTKSIKSRMSTIKAAMKNGKKTLKHVIISPGPVAIEKYDYWELRRKATEYLYSKSHFYAVKRFDAQSIHLEKYGFSKLGKSHTISQQKWKKLAEEIKEKIRKHFLIKFSAPSGVLIWHPYRMKAGCEDEYIDYLKNSTSGIIKTPASGTMKKWEWIRSKPNWRELVEYSPHFHFVGYAGYLQPSDKKEGWIYKTIRETINGNKVVSVLSHQDVYKVVNYLLTHTGVLKNKPYTHSYVWIGNLSTRNGGKTEVAEDVVMDSMDVILSGTDSDIIKKAIECKWCKEHNKSGKLRYFWKTLQAFFNAHKIGIAEDPEQTDWDKVSEQVKLLDVPNFMVYHILEAIKVKQRKPPPLGFEDYIIEYDG